MKIIPEEWIKTPDVNCDGLLQGTAADADVEFPLAIETHNVSEEEVTMGKEQEFEFIFEACPNIRVFDNEEKYKENKNNYMAYQSVIPCGLFPADPEKQKDFAVNPTAIITGVVNDVVADPTGFGFSDDAILYSADCLGWDMNCVIYRENNNIEKLEAGNVVQGTFIVEGWPVQ